MNRKGNKQKIYDKIKDIPQYGVLNYNQTKRFNDNKFFTAENLFTYSLSRIRFFLSEDNKIIYGIQAFYKKSGDKEEPGELGKDPSILDYNVINFDIPPNDYLCKMRVFTGDEYITKLIFSTKKGKSIEVGEDGGEDKKISYINNNTDKIILCLSGGYDKRLQLISCKYCSISDYFLSSRGFFELKILLKREDYKNNINKKFESLDKIDQTVLKICSLPDALFNSIIKYCYY